MVSQNSAIHRAGLEYMVAAVRQGAATRMRAGLAVTIAAAFALVLHAATANATTYTVNTLDDSSGNSDCSLRDAINAANGTPTPGSTCTTAGSGSDTINFSVTGTILLVNACSPSCGFSGLPQVTDSQLTINGPTPPGITIDGSNGAPFNGLQDMQVASGATVNLSNLTITNGLPESRILGGGIHNSGTLTVTNSTFPNNIAGSGGGIWNEGTLTVTNSTFSGNRADGLPGGGIFNSGTLTVTNSTFSGNIVIGDSGGGIYNSGTLTVTKSTFSGNSGTGGGIYNSGTGTVTNSTFSANSSGGGSGSGIFNFGTLTVTKSTLSGNSSTGIVNFETLTMTNSTLSGNSGLVGGIFNFGTLTMTNSTLSGNSGSIGVVFNNGSEGGGVANFKNTILADNVGGNCANTFNGMNFGGTILDAGYNISDDDSCGFSATGSLNSTNPLLSSLANNGGPTQTIALLSGSPAIDTVPSADCTDQSTPPKPITTDQRGFPRPDASEQVCDIGAYESQEPFAGQPGKPNCYGQSVSALPNQYGTIGAAASALGFPSVQALRTAIQEFCAG